VGSDEAEFWEVGKDELPAVSVGSLPVEGDEVESCDVAEDELLEPSVGS
jgi:hypothetical protein